MLLELNYFGRRYLAVVNTKSMAAIRSNVMLPLYTLNACDALVINTVGTNIIEIPELKQVLDIELSKEEYEEIHKNLTKIKEKCRTSNNDNCNKCLLSHERSCLMKVFATHHSYRPSPHNGDEFGDVSFPVTIDGHTVTLVGVIKSALAKNANLTRSSAPAREMFQQIFSMCQDSRVGLIAAICPSRFQDQFYEDLQYLSKLTQKPVVVLDDFYMCKQYKAAIEENIIS